uniref:Metalloendopeptidase n=1 Tax=Schmidtea mediterranea TaxID=79327 RepID=I1ZIC3_SCHMD|nr:tolloid like-1 [Schmidtea mediterranea]CCW36841.1 Ast3 protein [Schmidtea mediterranea]
MQFNMQKFLILIVLVLANEVASQCGCNKKKLMTRATENLHVGDMLLSKADIAIINGFKHHQREARAWPGGKVSFAFANDFPADKRNLVKQCLNELQSDLGNCVQFFESTQGPHIAVHAQNKGCYAMIGCTGERGQFLNLQNPWCMNSKGTIKHEFIHALGFMHTHMRMDRDNFISINWRNIQSSQCFNFVKCEGCIMDGNYETRSVMHYSSDAFGCQQGMNTMIQKNGNLIDYNHNTTPNDLSMIKSLYNCR